MTRVLQACSSQLEGPHDKPAVRLAPPHDFRGQPLRASFDAHLNESAPRLEYDPFYFIAVVDKDWQTSGLAVVAMDEEDGCQVDCLTDPAEDADLILINLQIANTGWYEHKLQYGDRSENEGRRGDGLGTCAGGEEE